ncbi:outer membrane protein assembly factor BamD [Marinoscillum sp. MHG1-6]|uniref:outer membrane protein assembly factor BamD n=1 Tax=Marinoscillum sp. MHG1-6 TaxID=2959627 RepID=UPI0021583CED|nr:outer membrane protein assembly factor BamD [Marinoscillum sp. MHG1-6]
MHKKIIRLFPLLLLMILIASCSKFRKIQKSGDWKLKYEAALKYYEEEDYYRAGILFEEILPIIRGTEEAEKANFLFAYTYFYQRQYILSAHQFKQFTRVYGRSEYVMEAAYMYANSLYLQSPAPSLDQTSTYEALAALQGFLNKYPYSEYSEQADAQVQDLQIKLEKKAYDNAKLYHKLRNYKSAIVAFDNFRLDYPDSKYQEEISFLAIESIYELAKVSIRSKQEERFQDTINKYENFVDRYPNSKYLQDAEKYYEDSIKELRRFADQNS